VLDGITIVPEALMGELSNGARLGVLESHKSLQSHNGEGIKVLSLFESNPPASSEELDDVVKNQVVDNKLLKL
jgi:hypothetical protein